MMKFKQPSFPMGKQKLPLKGASKLLKIKPSRKGKFEMEDD